MEIGNIIMLCVAGGLGALIKDVLRDNTIELPQRIDSKIILGSIGGIIIGMIVGYVVDQSFLTAFMGGFVGFSVIENLLPKKLLEEKKKSK